MSDKEQETRAMVEECRKLPEEVQQKIRWIIQGAELALGNAEKKGVQG